MKNCRILQKEVCKFERRKFFRRVNPDSNLRPLDLFFFLGVGTLFFTDLIHYNNVRRSKRHTLGGY